MRKSVKAEKGVEFTVSDPPFDYDPRDKGAMAKLAQANKSGLGKVPGQENKTTAFSVLRAAKSDVAVKFGKTKAGVFVEAGEAVEVIGIKSAKTSTVTKVSTKRGSAILKDSVESAASTSSIEGQIASLTERIKQVSEHLKTAKKDFSTHRGLMQMVGKRKRLLTYLSRHNLQAYRQLVEKLGLRK